MRKHLGVALAAVTLVALSAADAGGQSWLEKAKQKAKDKAAEQLDKKTEKAPEKVQKEPESGAKPAAASAEAESSAPAASTAAAAPRLRPGEGAWANYDFKPGERALYVDDFTKDEVGDFPRRMEFKEGALEIVQWQDRRWLRATNDSRFAINLPEVLPERYTIEFDFATPNGEMWMYFGDDQNKRVMLGTYYGQAQVYNHVNGVQAKGSFAGTTEAERNAVRRARILTDGSYMKVYVDDRRILNVPNAEMERSNKIRFWVDGDDKQPAMLGDFRVLAGGRKLYDALAEKGRVATQGIYFDTGSDRIRPESTPTLKEIGAMLAEHADLKLTIEGHTDDVGAAAANQALSEKRAEAVRAFLVETYKVDAARIAAKGLGSTKPAVQGTTPEARQQNRRVELVKM